jgi:hypothetical protein
VFTCEGLFGLLLDKGCDLYYNPCMNPTDEPTDAPHSEDFLEGIMAALREYEVRAYAKRLGCCQPDPDCPRCGGTGLAYGVEKVRWSFLSFLRRHRREIPFVEACPACLTPQWDAVTLDP